MIWNMEANVYYEGSKEEWNAIEKHGNTFENIRFFYDGDGCEHEWSDEQVVQKSPSCTKMGLSVIKCNKCGAVKPNSEQIIPAGHKWYTGEVTTAPTCTAKGTKTFTCTVCRETRTEDIEATGHKLVVDDEVTPTCTDTGLTEGSHCSVCNEILKAQEEVPALGHTWDDGVVTKKPTYTAEGIRTYTCAVCNATRTEAIAALERIDISVKTNNTTIYGVENKLYTGKAQTQSNLIVAVGAKTLKKDVDYTVSYSNNVNFGTATMTITGKNAYTGSVKKTFAIKTAAGKIYTNGNFKYKITNASLSGSGTVTLYSVVKKTAAVTVPSVIKLGGKYFKVTDIGAKSFKGNTTITSLAIGKNVTAIGEYAFYGCSSLKSVRITGSLKSIGKAAFYKCIRLTGITLPSTTYKLGSYAFYGCKNLKAMIVGSAKMTSTTVGAKAFTGTYATIRVRVPATKYAAYKKLFVAKGMSGKAVFVK